MSLLCTEFVTFQPMVDVISINVGTKTTTTATVNAATRPTNMRPMCISVSC
jgi:hypothetical protein